ncbi:S24 family peptidase [Salinibacter sp. 10B]|uniref:XRE family transcriptional regulator n=1 Tax=Salinibacter sp. 10B TaxID=1923971 RepID=UPI0011B04358|nr:S24 family peptidase [Salinibacter sp. 10B]
MGNTEKYVTGDRFRRIAEEMFDGNASELARALAMQPSSFYKYLNGERQPGASVLRRLTQLGVDLHWFLTGSGSMVRDNSHLNTLPPVDSTETQRKGTQRQETPDVEVSDQTPHRVMLTRVVVEEDGSPRLKDIEIEEWLSESLIRQTYGVDPSILRVFRVSGDAMKEILCPGDRIRAALWQGEALTDGSIYLFYQDPGGVLVRRVWIDGSQVRLVAEHSEVPARTLETGSWSNDFRPIARVLEVIRPL